MQKKRIKKRMMLREVREIVTSFCRIIFCVALIVAILSVKATSSSFSDAETKNLGMEIGTLEMSLRSDQSNFSPSSRADNLKPGKSVTRDFYIGKTGSLPFHYNATIQKDSTCDVDLFEILNLHVSYDFYHTQDPEYPNYEKYHTIQTVYDGKLSNFILDKIDSNNDALQIPNTNPYFNNRFYKENEHWLSFQIELPSDVEDSIQNKNCAFDFNFEAWQTSNIDSASGFHDKTSLSNGITTGDWIAPEEVTNIRFFKGHNSLPANEISCMGYTNDTKIRIAWDNSMANDIDYYWLGTKTNPKYKKVYENFYDETMISGKTPHSYTIIAVDTNGNESVISDPCGELNLDQNKPIISFTNISNGETLIGDFDIHGSLTDASPTNYAISIIAPTGTTEIDSENKTTNESFSNEPILTWDTTQSENGVYLVTFIAKDFAGNLIQTSVQVEVNNRTIDTAAPTVNVVFPKDQSTISDTVEIISSIMDANPKEYWVKIKNTITNLEVSNYSKHQEIDSFLNKNIETWDTTSMHDGPYTIEIHAKDQTENQNSDMIQVLVQNNNSTPLTPEQAEDFIVLNEFLPNPIGDDNAVMPAGEWIELYNKGNVDFNLNGWHIYNSNDNSGLQINTSNSDNNDDLSDSGETTIPANGFLVVYRNKDEVFSLNNNGDEVRLFNGSIESGSTLVDSHGYDNSIFNNLLVTLLGADMDHSTNDSAKAISEGNSFIRFPDAENNWIDSIPTPGEANKNESDIDNLLTYYKKACFDNDRPICDEDFMRELGIYPEEKTTDEKTKKEEVPTTISPLSSGGKTETLKENKKKETPSINLNKISPVIKEAPAKEEPDETDKETTPLTEEEPKETAIMKEEEFLKENLEK